MSSRGGYLSWCLDKGTLAFRMALFIRLDATAIRNFMIVYVPLYRWIMLDISRAQPAAMASELSSIRMN